jgi:hypothetical protein
MEITTFLVCLLPIVFMFHDFEEIIFFKPWVTKNKELLRSRFPIITSKFLPRFGSLSTSGFALAVAEEFIVLCIITYTSVYFNYYAIWLAAFMAFFIHLFIHLIQWIILKTYIPAIVTTIISLPYCFYTFSKIIGSNMFRVTEIIIWSIIGFIIMGVNLLVAHKLSEKIDNWIRKTTDNLPK